MSYSLEWNAYLLVESSIIALADNKKLLYFKIAICMNCFLSLKQVVNKDTTFKGIFTIIFYARFKTLDNMEKWVWKIMHWCSLELCSGTWIWHTVFCACNSIWRLSNFIFGYWFHTKLWLLNLFHSAINQATQLPYEINF